MRHSKDAEELLKLAELVDGINEAGMIQTPNNTSGPGAKKRSTPNDYTRQDVAKMLDYAKQFVMAGKQQSSWEYDQNWLNMVGDGLKQFMALQKGDPALDYEPGTMQGDMHNDSSYGKLSFGKADKGKLTGDMKSSGPGPQRGRRMNRDHD